MRARVCSVCVGGTCVRVCGRGEGAVRACTCVVCGGGGRVRRGLHVLYCMCNMHACVYALCMYMNECAGMRA